MALDLQVVAYPKYLQATLTGDVTRQATQDAFKRIADAALEYRLSLILIDWRPVTTMDPASTMDVFEGTNFLASQVLRLRTYGLHEIRIVHVAPRVRPHVEGFSVTVAANRGLTMTAVTTVDEALAWLGVEDEA